MITIATAFAAAATIKFLVFHFSDAAPSNPLEELGQCK